MDKTEEHQEFLADTKDTDTRLDHYLVARLPDISRAQLQRFIENGQALVNGKTVRSSHRLQAGDRVAIEHALETTASDILPQDIPLEIVYEDSDLLVINKPKGMVVHPAPGALDGTLVNALLFHCKDLSGIGGVERPGIVHRLDKDTSGLLMVAKNDIAHVGLQKQIQARTASRKYIAYIWGSPRWEKAVVDAPISRHSIDRKRMAIAEKGAGREAITHIRVTDRLGSLTRIECALETGRTHQIRLHCEFAGHPVVGDPIYGGLRRSGVRALDELVATLHGQALHAFELAFAQPRTREPLHFNAAAPAELLHLDTFARQAAKDWAG